MLNTHHPTTRSFQSCVHWMRTDRPDEPMHQQTMYTVCTTRCICENTKATDSKEQRQREREREGGEGKRCIHFSCNCCRKSVLHFRWCLACDMVLNQSQTTSRFILPVFNVRSTHCTIHRHEHAILPLTLPFDFPFNKSILCGFKLFSKSAMVRHWIGLFLCAHEFEAHLPFLFIGQTCRRILPFIVKCI